MTSLANEDDSTKENGEIEFLDKRNKRIDSLYETTNYSDVTFIIEDQKIPAHRCILAARSEYFRSLLYGPFSEAKQTEVKIKAPVDAFKILLEYIYTGRLSLSKILNIEVIIDIVELGNAYYFPELQNPCEKYLKKIISIDNVCLILDGTKNLNFYDLKKVCLYFIDKNADYILTDESFLSLSKDVLTEILIRDSFYTPEIGIFHAVNAWCKKNNYKIEDLIHLVRMPLISADELVQGVWKSSSLTPEKIFNIFEEQAAVKPFKRRGILVRDENVATIKNNSKTIQGDMGHSLLNEDIQTYNTSSGYTRHSITESNDSAIIVELGCNYIINHIKLLLWDCDLRSYSYFIEVSIDQKNWDRVVDYSTYFCRSWQYLFFESRAVKYIKVVGTQCSANNYFDVVSLRALYHENISKIKTRFGIVVPKFNVALSKFAIVLEGRGNPNKNNVISGDFLNKNGFTYHTIGSAETIVIQLNQPYYLGSLRLLLYDVTTTLYGFYIETSLNNKEWRRVVDKTEEPVKSWQCLNFPLKPVIFIKLVGTSPLNTNFNVVHIECPSSIEN